MARPVTCTAPPTVYVSGQPVGVVDGDRLKPLDCDGVGVLDLDTVLDAVGEADPDPAADADDGVGGEHHQW
jgi:hypothetical protein